MEHQSLGLETATFSQQREFAKLSELELSSFLTNQSGTSSNKMRYIDTYFDTKTSALASCGYMLRHRGLLKLDGTVNNQWTIKRWEPLSLFVRVETLFHGQRHEVVQALRDLPNTPIPLTADQLVTDLGRICPTVVCSYMAVRCFDTRDSTSSGEWVDVVALTSKQCFAIKTTVCQPNTTIGDNKDAQSVVADKFIHYLRNTSNIGGYFSALPNLSRFDCTLDSVFDVPKSLATDFEALLEPV